MSRLLWRISDFADLSGKGGLYASARWHSKGSPILYAAESSTGALSELLVHLPRDLMAPDFQLLTLAVEDTASIMDVPALSPEWRHSLAETRRLGDAWLRSKTTLLMRVPSALVPQSHNVLINPLHPDISKTRIIKQERVPIDPRLR